MARTKRTLSREQQRAIVLNSEQYKSGDEFNRTVISPLLGLSNEGVCREGAGFLNGSKCIIP